MPPVPASKAEACKIAIAISFQSSSPYRASTGIGPGVLGDRPHLRQASSERLVRALDLGHHFVIARRAILAALHRVHDGRELPATAFALVVGRHVAQGAGNGATVAL